MTPSSTLAAMTHPHDGAHDDHHGGRDDHRITFVEDEQHVSIAGLVAAGRFDRVVQTQHGRRRPSAKDPPAHVEPIREASEAPRGPTFVRRCRVEAERRLGDHAERPLGTDEDLGQIGADRGTRGAACADQPPAPDLGEPAAPLPD